MPFVTFEGIDGSGKSTLMAELSNHLQALGQSLEVTREPGGTELGVELRRLLLRTDGEAPCPKAELLIYEADRAQHVETKIKPLLEKGYWVISDRHADSSLAFQGAGRKISLSDVAWLNTFATSGLVPDVTILVDCPYDVAVQRRKERTADRFESEERNFHEAIRTGYLKIAQENKNRFVILDGTKTPEQLFVDLIAALKAKKLL